MYESILLRNHGRLGHGLGAKNLIAVKPASGYRSTEIIFLIVFPSQLIVMCEKRCVLNQGNTVFAQVLAFCFRLILQRIRIAVNRNNNIGVFFVYGVYIV